jgi:murein DD-endopeptidase MepM/ murein hydrolase activator NlpD
VHSARDGTVVRVTDGYEEGGTTADMLQKANSVLIQHQDSTVAYYSHLQHGIPVKVGDHVRRGAMIAYSGNTGLSSGPHLHFAVKHLEIQPGRELQETALAPLFETDEGPKTPLVGQKFGRQSSSATIAAPPARPTKNGFNWTLFWTVLTIGSLSAWTTWRRLRRQSST